MTFLEHVRAAKGSIIKARRTYIRERRWPEEQWYVEWQTTDLPGIVNDAIKEHFGDQKLQRGIR